MLGRLVPPVRIRSFVRMCRAPSRLGNSDTCRDQQDNRNPAHQAGFLAQQRPPRERRNRRFQAEKHTEDLLGKMPQGCQLAAVRYDRCQQGGPDDEEHQLGIVRNAPERYGAGEKQGPGDHTDGAHGHCYGESACTGHELTDRGA